MKLRPSTVSLYFFLVFSLCLIVTVGVLNNAMAESSIRALGKINPDAGNTLSISQIESLGLVRVIVDDPFEGTEQSYSGVELGRFVSHFGAVGTEKVTFKAIDDYEITFTREEWESIRILVVTRMSGKHINFANKGPVRIIYPDYDPQKHNSKEIMPRWIWMIRTVHFD